MTHDHGGFLTEKSFNRGLAYSFRGLVQDHHGRKQGGRQADTGAVVENYVLTRRQREREPLPDDQAFKCMAYGHPSHSNHYTWNSAV